MDEDEQEATSPAHLAQHGDDAGEKKLALVRVADSRRVQELKDVEDGSALECGAPGNRVKTSTIGRAGLARCLGDIQGNRGAGPAKLVAQVGVAARAVIRTASARNSMAQRYTSSRSKSRSGRSMSTHRLRPATVAFSSSSSFSTARARPLPRDRARTSSLVPERSQPNLATIRLRSRSRLAPSRRASTKRAGEP